MRLRCIFTPKQYRNFIEISLMGYASTVCSVLHVVAASSGIYITLETAQKGLKGRGRRTHVTHAPSNSWSRDHLLTCSLDQSDDSWRGVAGV